MEKSVILTSGLPAMYPIIKIVGNFCNLKCRYCFYNAEDQKTKTVMSVELLEKFIREYLQLFNGNLRFIWHGGEPLLAGMKFFEKIIEFQKLYATPKHNIVNSIQSNGTLIDDTWAKFFKEYDFRVGISIDGIEKCHDYFRKNKHGKGSFEHVVRGIKILKKHEIPVSIIATLSKHNLSHTKENFLFFTESLGIKTIANCVYCSNDNPELSRFSIEPEDLTIYLKKIIDLWLKKGDSNIRVREIENYLASILGKKASLCLFNGWCTSFFCLEYDGQIYPCDKLSGRKEMLFGNLTEHSLREVLNSEKRKEYVKHAKSLSSDCLSCKWKQSCNNGCVYYREKNGKFLFCETRKEIFKYLTEKVGYYSK